MLLGKDIGDFCNFLVFVEAYFMSKYMVNFGQSSVSCWEKKDYSIRLGEIFCKNLLGSLGLLGFNSRMSVSV